MTEKKKYEKPSTRVIELQHRTHLLLAGSNPNALNDPNDYEDGGYDPFNP